MDKGISNFRMEMIGESFRQLQMDRNQSSHCQSLHAILLYLKMEAQLIIT